MYTLNLGQIFAVNRLLYITSSVDLNVILLTSIIWHPESSHYVMSW